MLVYRLLLIFVFLEYVRPGNVIPGMNVLHLNLLVPLCAAAISIAGSRAVRHGDILKEANSKYVLGLLGLIALSVPMAELTWSAIEVFQTVAGYALIYWVLAKEINEVDELKGVFHALIIVHLIAGARSPEMFTNSSSRAYVIHAAPFLGDGNDFGLSALLAMVFCLFLLFEAKSKWRKLLYSAELLSLLALIVATQSRGATLALGAVALYYWLKNDRKVIGLTVAAVSVVLVVALAPTTYFDRINSIQNYEEDGSAQGRLSAWRAGTNMALSNPLLGVGAGQFPSNYTRFADDNQHRWKTAHSIYFLILGELGLPGITILIGLIISNLVGNWRVAREIWPRAPGGRASTEIRLLATMSAAMLAFAIGGAFLSATYYPHAFVLSGLTVAVRRIVLQRTAIAAASTAKVPDVSALTVHWAMRGTIDPQRAHHA